MDEGLQLVFFGYGWSNVSDRRSGISPGLGYRPVWDEEPCRARLAVDPGFDVLWSLEHRFNDYSFCPDNLQLMTCLAAVCPAGGLGMGCGLARRLRDDLRVADRRDRAEPRHLVVGPTGEFFTHVDWHGRNGMR